MRRDNSRDEIPFQWWTSVTIPSATANLGYRPFLSIFN